MDWNKRWIEVHQYEGYEPYRIQVSNVDYYGKNYSAIDNYVSHLRLKSGTLITCQETVEDIDVMLGRSDVSKEPDSKFGKWAG